MLDSRPVLKYLKSHAEPEARCGGLIGGDFREVIVIPAYAEGDQLLPTLASIPAATNGGCVLTIVVVNEPEDAPTEHRKRTALTLDALRACFGPRTRIAEACFVQNHRRGMLLTVERVGARALPQKQGVGLARKIGFDVALAAALHRGDALRFMHTTDADALLPVDYFHSTNDAPPDAAALLHPFTHGDDEAASEYEAFLRYYVRGLRYARSPYAFHTIGSTMAVSTEAYAMVRGVPKRSAGEDFYLLNKLRKVGQVHSLPGEPLRLSARRSQRTPFGTGQRLHSHDAGAGALRAYHPRVFVMLRAMLDGLAQAATSGFWTPPAEGELTVSECEVVSRAAEVQGVAKAIAHANAHGRDGAARQRQLDTYFDAFRTLKFVHYVRAHAHPSVPLSEALRAAAAMSA